MAGSVHSAPLPAASVGEFLAAGALVEFSVVEREAARCAMILQGLLPQVTEPEVQPAIRAQVEHLQRLTEYVSNLEN